MFVGQERCVPDVEVPPIDPLDLALVWSDGDRSCGIPNAENIRNHFLSGGVLASDDARALIERATDIFRTEPNVLSLAEPITVCGDIHGQYYDLMTLFEVAGDPASTQFLFLGDYVDRGSFSTEVTLYLYALKILRPNALWMLRGNHECRHLTEYFNFKEECLHKYDITIYDLFQVSFDALPLAALLNDSFLCVHGGLSPEVKCVDDIAIIDRFREPPTTGPMCDLLWSDPMEDEEEEICPDALFLHNELRGCSFVFSSAAVIQFLKANNLSSIIRAHEAQDEGYRLFRKVSDTGFPGVVCVFSAPNYCDAYDNKASILQFSEKSMHVRQFHSVAHPYCLPNFMNAFSWSFPFVCDKVDELLTAVLDCASDEEEEEEEEVYYTDRYGVANVMQRGRQQQQQRHRDPHRGVASGEYSSGDEDGPGRAAARRGGVVCRRGTIMRAKVLACVRFIHLLADVRHDARSAEKEDSE